VTGRWRLLYAGAEAGPFPGRLQIEPLIVGLRDKWAAGEVTTRVVTVQVNDGGGWQDREVIDFAHEEGDAA
jgi:hypothetical protein